MEQDKKDIWTNALRSGKYRQAVGSFTERMETEVVKHCCLAVLTHEAVNHDAPGVRWRDGEDKPEVVAIFDPEVGEWKQVAADEVEHVMQNVEEAGDGPLPDDREMWAWVPEGEVADNLLPLVVQDWAGIDGCDPQLGPFTAAEWNDDEQADFDKIADLIEEHL